MSYFQNMQYKSNLEKNTMNELSDIQIEKFLSKKIVFKELNEPLLIKPKARDILSDDEFLSYGLVITDDMIRKYIFLKYTNEKIEFRKFLIKDLSFNNSEARRTIYEKTLLHKFMLAQYEYDIKLLDESESLAGEELYRYYKQNTIEYRKFLIKNKLLNPNNEIAVLSSILKFIPHLSIRKQLEKYFIEKIGFETTQKIKLFRAPKKQKQYYKSVSKTKTIDARLKEVAMNYADRIIYMYQNEKISVKKIREILSQEAREQKLIPLTVKRFSRKKDSKSSYQDPIESKTMLSIRVIKSIIKNKNLL